MTHRVLIVPGYRGSGPEHWQTWLEGRLPRARRVGRIDWEAPVIAHWPHEIRNDIACSPDPVWLIAHSFGCLAALVAAVGRSERIAGAMLVAPADPERFSPSGLKVGRALASSLSLYLPRQPLPFPSMVVASNSDPWMQLKVAAQWADRWGSRFVSVGDAGHINVEAGFGPWPRGLELFESLQRSAPRERVGSSLAMSFGWGHR